MSNQSGAIATRRVYSMAYVMAAMLMTCVNMAVVKADTLALNYSMREETMTSLGDILVDSGLSRRYNATLSDHIRFTILKGAYAKYFRFSAPRRNVLRTSDVLLDRDVICPKYDSCVVQLDVAVAEPISLFQIIKVKVTVDDLNDNAPTFPEPEATIHISESTRPGTPTVLPVAYDYDSGLAGNVSYDLYPDSSSFSLDHVQTVMGSDELRLVPAENLDREVKAEYKFEIRARDNGTPRLSGTLQLTVLITDTNDNSPAFEHSLYNVTISEDYHVTTPFLRIHATDLDTGDNGAVVYAFSQQTALQYGDTFGLDPSSGDLFLVSELDYETVTSYYLTVIAKDKGPDSRTATARVVVLVENVNDVMPRVTVNVLTSSGVAEVTENGEVGQFVAHLSVEDPDGGSAGDVSCGVIGTDQFAIVEIYENEFKLVTNDSFDRELNDVISVSVTCTDKGTPPLSTTETLQVAILDSNDNIPSFVQQTYTTSIRENSSYPQPIFFVSAIDHDYDVNGKVSYHVDKSGEKYLAVNATSGLVSSNCRLDRERIERFTTLVYATDGGSPPLTGTATISVIVDDVNDEAPYFLQTAYVFGTFENQAIGTAIGQVAALDNDSGPRASVVYTLSPDSPGRNIFKIDPETGRISTKRILDREQEEAYMLEVVATDVMYPYYTATTTVSIHIADKNDNAPTIVFPTKVNDTVQLSAFADKGTSVTKIVAHDADLGKNAQLVYQLSKGNEEQLFDVNPASGEVMLQESLDGKERVFNILVAVEDQGTPKKTALTNLYIVVNGSIGVSGDRNSETGRLRSPGARIGLSMEMTIVIIVGCLSAVLAGCLATLLACLCRRYKRPENRKRADVSKNGSQGVTYDDVKAEQESGNDEPVITPLTSVTLAESLDQQSPGDPEDRVDMWITGSYKKEDIVPHLDSGHGSWAESGSECGTVVLDHSAAGPRGYFRRPVGFGVQDHNPKPQNINLYTPEHSLTSSSLERLENYANSGSQTLVGGDFTAVSPSRSGSAQRPERFFLRGPPMLPEIHSLHEPARTQNKTGLKTFSGDKQNFVKNNFHDVDTKIPDLSPVTDKRSGSTTSSFSSGRNQELQPLTGNQTETQMPDSTTSVQHGNCCTQSTMVGCDERLAGSDQ